MFYQISVTSVVCLTLVITGWTVANRADIDVGQFRSDNRVDTVTNPEIKSATKTYFAKGSWFSSLFFNGGAERNEQADTSVAQQWMSRLNPFSKAHQDTSASKGRWMTSFLSFLRTCVDDITAVWFWAQESVLRILRESQTPWWILKGLMKWIDSVSLNNSLLVLLFTLPYVPVFLLKIRKKSELKKNCKTRSKSMKMGTQSDTVINDISGAEAEKIIARFQSLQLANGNVAKDLNRKDSELKLMARLVEFLQKTCRRQAGEIQKKGSELEEMARTVEYLQRPSSKRWSDMLDRVYKSTYSEMITIEHYQLYVPLDGAEKGDNPASHPSILEKDESNTEVNSDTELDWDEWG